MSDDEAESGGAGVGVPEPGLAEARVLCVQCKTAPVFVGSRFCSSACKGACATAAARASSAAAVAESAPADSSAGGDHHRPLCKLEGCWRETFGARIGQESGEFVSFAYCCRNHAVADQPEFSESAERTAAEWFAYGTAVPWKQDDLNGVLCDLPDCGAGAHYSRRTAARVHHCCRRHAEVDVLRGLTDLDPQKIGPDACRSAAAYRFWRAAPDGPVTTKDRDLPRKKKCALSGCFRPRWIAAGGRDCKFCSKAHAKEGTSTGQYSSTLWRPEWHGPAHAPSLDPRKSSSEPDRRDSVSSQGSVASARFDSDGDGAVHSSATPTARELQLKAQLDAQAQALRELQAEVRGSGAAAAAAGPPSAGTDDEDETGPEGPFAPHYWERDAAVQNPHRPLRDRLISEAPHVYRVKDVDNEYVQVLRARKGQAYHEYLTLACITSYYWDVNTYLDEIANKLTAGGTAEEQADKRDIVASSTASKTAENTISSCVLA